MGTRIFPAVVSKVNQFERNCEQYFKVKHAITVTLTSGLTVAMGAIGIEPEMRS